MKSRTFGTWIWNVDSMKKSSEVIGFLTSKKITEVYLAYDPQTAHQDYRTFVKSANQNGIRVSLIGADAHWILDSGAAAFDSFLHWFSDYQSGCQSADERFYGVHYDIEPHQLSEWTDELDSTITKYAAFILKAKEACRKENVLLEVDIPFWFDLFNVTDNGEEIPLCEFCFRYCDTTLLMSYRDNAREVFDCGSFELKLSKKYKKKVILALETGKIYEEINITFYHLGTEALEQELESLDQIVKQESEPYEIGYAVHYYECWSTLPDKGHPKGSDYPYTNPNYK